jgi:serine/threonine protein kinase/Tol biopolymer transport system component
MTPERYQKIKELFQAALEQKPEERAAFLGEVCAGDEDLRKEVESLVASDEQTGSFIDSPAYESNSSSLTDTQSVPLAGRQISSYKILSLLGRGGMGEVYLAQDTRLGRKVALKLLPASSTRDEGRLRRFQQEARAVSALNHPNILTIYEIGQVDNQRFIATEFIEGETLRKLLERSRMPVQQVLDIAMQVAGALAAAHQAGIIHRDIKPENIMLRHDGYVKVLDFGLAKLMKQRVPALDTEALTVAKMDTDPGIIMGTVTYMSPEQTRGEKVDGRTDIWSLGVILYEMIAGRAPFAGRSASDVIASILQKEPATLARYSSEVPAELQWIVSKALRKDRDERYHSAKELVSDLKNLKRELEHQDRLERSSTPEESPLTGAGVGSGQLEARTADQPVVPTAEAVGRTTSSAEVYISEIKRHKAGASIAIATLLVLLGLAAFGVYQWANHDKPANQFEHMRISKLTTTGKMMDAVISPDGKYVVDVMEANGLQSLWVRQISTSSSVQIVPPADTSYTGLTISKDGEQVYYVREGKADRDVLYEIPILGGNPKRIADRLSSTVTISPDGERLAFVSSDDSYSESQLILCNREGGEQQKLAARKQPEFYDYPAWSPDGKTIVCAVQNFDANGIYWNVTGVRVEDRAQTPVSHERWTGVGKVAWLKDGSGLILPVKERPTTPYQLWYLSYPAGETHRITNDVNNYMGVSLTADSKTLVTIQTETNSNLWLAPDSDYSHAKQLTFGNHDGILGIAFTPDNKIVYCSTASGNYALWICDADGNNAKQLTRERYISFYPVVSPDGQFIFFAFFGADGPSPNLWRMRLDGTEEKQLTNYQWPATAAPMQCTPDNKWLVYELFGDAFSLNKISTEGGEPVRIAEGFYEYSAVSPDGKLIACRYVKNGKERASLIPFEGGQPVRDFEAPVNPPRSELSNYAVRWTVDGHAITLIDTRDGVSNIWSQPIDGGPRTQLSKFQSGAIFSFDWSRDGKQLICARGSQTSDVVLISNFK